MPNMFAVNVYQINDYTLKTVERHGFNASNVHFRPAPSGTTSATGVSLYGIVQELPRGLNVNSVNYYTVETVAQLVTAAG